MAWHGMGWVFDALLQSSIVVFEALNNQPEAGCPGIDASMDAMAELEMEVAKTDPACATDDPLPPPPTGLSLVSSARVSAPRGQGE